MQIKQIYINLLLKSLIMISSALFFLLIGILFQQSFTPQSTNSDSGVSPQEVTNRAEPTFRTVSGTISSTSPNSFVLILASQKKVRVTLSNQTTVQRFPSQAEFTRTLDESDALDSIPTTTPIEVPPSTLRTGHQVVIESQVDVVGISNIPAQVITIFE